MHLRQVDAGVVESLVRYGCSLTDSGLTPKLMTQSACQCQKSKCSSRVCKCVKAGLLCSPTCGCESDSDLCKNTVSFENQNEENICDDSSDSDYD